VTEYLVKWRDGPNIHDVDIRIVNKSLVGFVRGGETMLLLEGCSLDRVTSRDTL